MELFKGGAAELGWQREENICSGSALWHFIGILCRATFFLLQKTFNFLIYELLKVVLLVLADVVGSFISTDSESLKAIN